MEIVYTDEILERASRGYIDGYYSSKEPTTDKPSLDTVLRVFRSEPTVVSAIRAISDEIIKNGYLIKTENKQLKKIIEKDLLKKYRFKRILRRLVYNLLIYGNVFVEVVYKDNQPAELHLLETTDMEIISNEHGEVLGYKQEHDGKIVNFTTEECVHLSLNNITSALWGEVDMKVLYQTISLKQFLEKFLINLFRYNKFRDAWKIESADEVQIKNFINDLKLARDQPDKELVVEGEITKIAGREINDLDKLVELLNYTRQQILTLLRVPPIIAGIPDNSNRSNSEVQARKAFDGRVKSIQDVISDELSWELFPKLGWENADIEFGPIDKRAEKDDIEIIKALKEIGIDDDTLLKYIKQVGIQLPEGAKIEKGVSPLFKDESEESKPEDKSGPVEHKTGEEAETREDQIMGRSEEWILDQYAEEVLKK
jgi:hypothetical protein|tara:strand:+ start:666 stop:1946 length:1281 start_codon:yes stop_codon:yes gene_type:complete